MFPDISGDYVDSMPGADEHQLNTAINFFCSTLHVYPVMYCLVAPSGVSCFRVMQHNCASLNAIHLHTV